MTSCLVICGIRGVGTNEVCEKIWVGAQRKVKYGLKLEEEVKSEMVPICSQQCE